MIAKLIEVRDKGTFMPCVAIKCLPANEPERFLLARGGYGRTPARQSEYILFGKIDGSDIGKLTYDVHAHGSTRTMQVAHQYVIDHFDELEPGAVVCVEHILGERPVPKESESVAESRWPL